MASGLQSSLTLWDVARRYAPERYLDILKLRYPAYVKLVLGNEFARTQITTKFGGAAGQYYGPFRSRGAAEEFEHQFLDLFQLRRCQEDLTPSADHPGCIYGEMGMCLRPCQQIVGREEYASGSRTRFRIPGIRRAAVASDWPKIRAIGSARNSIMKPQHASTNASKRFKLC